MARPGEITEGMLYLGGTRNGLPVWRQPGGPGTLVFPQLPTEFPWFGGQDAARAGSYEWPMNYPAQYYFGCGHPLNCAEIYSFADIYNDDTVMAAICCPMCSFIQQLMTLEQYENYIETPLVIA